MTETSNLISTNTGHQMATSNDYKHPLASDPTTDQKAKSKANGYKMISTLLTTSEIFMLFLICVLLSTEKPYKAMIKMHLYSIIDKDDAERSVIYYNHKHSSNNTYIEHNNTKEAEHRKAQPVNKRAKILCGDTTNKVEKETIWPLQEQTENTYKINKNIKAINIQRLRVTMNRSNNFIK
jgi:hypothetical protein